MNRERSSYAYQGQEPNMYDDQPYGDDRYAASYGTHSSRKDQTSSPPRGAAEGRPYNSAQKERSGRWDGRDGYNARDYDRSRSPQREGRRRYTDRDQEGYRSPRRERSRSRSPYYGAPPNRSVILEGIPIDLTQEDHFKFTFTLSVHQDKSFGTLAKHRTGHIGQILELQIMNELQQSLRLEGLEEVRVIKDKRTGQSRGFAFAQFVGIPEARRFLEDYYPTLSLYGVYDPSKAADTEPSKVRIAFSRERDEREKAGKGEDDWKCEVCYIPNFSHRTLCFRCNAPRTRSTAQGVVVAQGNMSAHSGFATTGDSDVAPEGAVSQFLLFRGLEPGVTEELLVKGVNKLVKAKSTSPPLETQSSKKNKISSTTNDASLGAREGSLRRVLLVRDRKTNDSWRYGFAEFGNVEEAQAAMIKFKSLDKFTIASKPVSVSYIHAGVFVPVLQQVSEAHEKFTFSPLSNTSVKLMYWDESAFVSELVTAAPDQPLATRSKESEHAKLAAAAANEGLVTSGKDGEPKLKKRKVEKENKVVAPHLQFWTNRHAEIHGLPSKDVQVADSSNTPAKITKVEAPPSQSFADLDRKCCLLCSRQFKTEAEVNKHERMSQLHRDNLGKEDLVTKALAKLNKSNESSSTDNAAYRDRAKERRQAFNQPKQPAAQHNRSAPENSKATTVAVAEPPVVQSKGAALLGKMGWTAGQGLGAEGTGRTEAIKTDLYQQGVGLGALGGKVGDAAEEAHRQTKGNYADFVDKTRDKAKERYENMF